MDFNEKKLVEDYILKKLVEKGWKFIPADNLERDSYKEPLLIPSLVRSLERINKGVHISDEEKNKDRPDALCEWYSSGKHRV